MRRELRYILGIILSSHQGAVRPKQCCTRTPQDELRASDGWDLHSKELDDGRHGTLIIRSMTKWQSLARR